MSIARFILRQLTVKALLGRTMAETRVKDSNITDLETVIMDSPAPIMLVYTDDEEFVPDDSKTIMGGQGSTTIVIIVAVAGALKLKDGEVQYSYPSTNETIEMSIDFMERQIQMALTDPENDWAQLWLELVQNVTKWRSTRGGSTKEGARFGARMVMIDVETLADPTPGGPAQYFWEKVLAKMETDPFYQQIMPGIRAMIEGNRELTTWQRTMIEKGYTFATLKGVGLAPMVAGVGPNEEPAILETVIIDPLGVSSDDIVLGDDEE